MPVSRLSRTERIQFKKQKREAERQSRDRKRFIKKCLTQVAIGLLAVTGLGWLGYSMDRGHAARQNSDARGSR